MFSPRLLAVFALLATVVALPATEKPKEQVETNISDDDFFDSWFSFPMIQHLFAPLWRLFPNFGDIGPKIVVDDDKFQVIVNVKDYNKTDLKVKVKGDFIYVQGTHEAKRDDQDLFASQFFHTYSLPANTSSSEVTAELYNDGILKVSAPLNGTEKDKDASADREVPIVETGVPYKDDKAEKSTEKSTLVTEDDRKEETTPAIDSTEKDNSIPHGNEVSP